jgi:16S rRNA (adenine1518-N6/adenine1519-N6)-dimethyltransferase
MSQYPPLEIVDENDKVIGKASLDEIYRRKLIHRVAMIVVREPAGKILLQRRSAKVFTNPNRWDVSAAGHVDAGESYNQAAIRELHEELGVSNVELAEAAYYFSDTTLDGKHQKRFVKIYTVTLPADTTFSIEPSEVSEVRWFSLEELSRLFEQQPHEFNQDLSVSLAKLKILI